MIATITVYVYMMFSFPNDWCCSQDGEHRQMRDDGNDIVTGAGGSLEEISLDIEVVS